MHPSKYSALLIEAPVDRHFAQVHRTQASLRESVGLYIETGLRRHHSVVVIATAANIDAFLDHLVRAGMPPDTYRQSGQLQVFDADDALSRIMNGDVPSWREFRRIVGSALDRARSFERTGVRAYGEMVNVLWRRKRAKAAIQLEEYWNEIGKDYPFSLFCAYMQDSLEEKSCMNLMPEIGRTHSEIVGSGENDRFQEALDAASRDIYGIPLSQLIGDSAGVEWPGEDRLPVGQRSMLWMIRHIPASSAKIFEAARHYSVEDPANAITRLMQVPPETTA